MEMNEKKIQKLKSILFRARMRCQLAAARLASLLVLVVSRELAYLDTITMEVYVLYM